MSIRFPWWVWAVSAGLLTLLALGAGFLFLRQTPHPRESVDFGLLPSQTLPKGDFVAIPGSERNVKAEQQSAVKGVANSKAVQSKPAGLEKSVEISIPAAKSVSVLVFASQETGLTVHWYVNKEFRYKEEKK